MTEFKVGDRVRHLPGEAVYGYVKVGEIYTVSGVTDAGLRFKETDGDTARFSYEEGRFEKVEDPAPAVPLNLGDYRPATILDEAQEVVDGPRRAAYGHPSVNHSRTAAMWSAYLGIPISMRQVCMLNALQKVSRDANSSKRDNLVDLAGWARNAELVEE